MQDTFNGREGVMINVSRNIIYASKNWIMQKAAGLGSCKSIQQKMASIFLIPIVLNYSA
jgi:hypothetical protein